MSPAGLAAASCLQENQSGLSALRRRPLSVAQAQASLVEMDSMAMEVYEAVTGIKPPPIYRTYQARAVSAASRSKANITKILLHTPEGSTAGTLGVLNGTGAGFDWFLPPAGELYKCNETTRYIAWQAGDWPTNQVSLGIEQWDYASRMHLAPEAHYQRLARLCAYLADYFEIKLAHATTYGGIGFIYHRTVTPGARCDPDACGQSKFNIDKLLSLTSDYMKGSGPSPKPEPEPQGKVLYRVSAAGKQTGAYESKAYALQEVGKQIDKAVEVKLTRGK